MDEIKVTKEGDAVIMEVEGETFVFTDEKASGIEFNGLGDDELYVMETCLIENRWMRETTVMKEVLKDELPERFKDSDPEDWDTSEFYEEVIEPMIEQGLFLWTKLNGVRWLKATAQAGHWLSEKERTTDMYG